MHIADISHSKWAPHELEYVHPVVNQVYMSFLRRGRDSCPEVVIRRRSRMLIWSCSNIVSRRGGRVRRWSNTKVVADRGGHSVRFANIEHRRSHSARHVWKQKQEK